MQSDTPLENNSLENEQVNQLHFTLVQDEYLQNLYAPKGMVISSAKVVSIRARIAAQTNAKNMIVVCRVSP